MILNYSETFVNVLEALGKYVKEPITIDNNIINVKIDEGSLEIFSVLSENDCKILHDDKSEPDKEDNKATFLNVAEVSGIMNSFGSLPKVKFDEEWIWITSGDIELNIPMGDDFLVERGTPITMSKHVDKEINITKYIGDVILGQKKVKSKTFDLGIEKVGDKREIVCVRTIEEEFGSGLKSGKISDNTKFFRFSIDAAKLINSIDDDHITSYILFKNSAAMMLIKIDFEDSDSYLVFNFTSQDID